MHWLSTQWFTYWWPSDLGNGPENVQWTVLAVIVVSLMLPRVRRFFKRHFESVHAKLDKHHEEVLRQAEAHHVKQMSLAKKHHEEHMAALKPVEKTGTKRGANGRFTK